MRFELRSLAHESLREHGCTMTPAAIDGILGKDFELNAAGLAAWMTRAAYDSPSASAPPAGAHYHPAPWQDFTYPNHPRVRVTSLTSVMSSCRPRAR